MQRRGFTLIEIMIAVAVIAILAAIAIPNFMSYRTVSHAKACMANMKLIREACQSVLVRRGTIETSLDNLSDNTRGDAFLKGKPLCPIGGTYLITFDESAQDFSVKCSMENEDDHKVSE